jgi:predicted small lipoprotein YifL
MHCWARYLWYAVIAVLAVGQMVAACGQKGPLFLPEPQPAAETASSAPAAPRGDGALDSAGGGLGAAEDVPPEDVPEASPGPQTN